MPYNPYKVRGCQVIYFFSEELIKHNHQFLNYNLQGPKAQDQKLNRWFLYFS